MLVLCSENLAIESQCFEHEACALRHCQMKSSRLSYPFLTFQNMHYGICHALLLRETANIVGTSSRYFSEFSNFPFYTNVQISVAAVVDPANECDSTIECMKKKNSHMKEPVNRRADAMAKSEYFSTPTEPRRLPCRGPPPLLSIPPPKTIRSAPLDFFQSLPW